MLAICAECYYQHDRVRKLRQTDDARFWVCIQCAAKWPVTHA